MPSWGETDSLLERYKASDNYNDVGLSQKIARRIEFEFGTLLVIGLNSIYIGVSQDRNINPHNTLQ